MARHDLGGGIWLYTDDEWRTSATQPGSLDARPLREHSITEFIGHHSGGATLGAPDTDDWLRGIYNYHVHDRGYDDIAYNAAIRDGIIWECRPGWAVGGHTTGHNTVGYGVVILRDQRTGDVPFGAREQLAMQKAYALACLAAGRSSLTALTHRQVGQTACPGDDVGDWIEGGGLTRRVPVPPTGEVPRFPGLLQRGDRKPGVRLAERKLKQRGWRGLDVDDYFGPATERVVSLFQREKRIPVTGKIDKLTWYVIFLAPVT